jgi:magnesium transporter
MDDALNLPPIEEIELMIADGRLEDLQKLLAPIHPADIAVLLEEVETETAVTIFELLPIEIASEVLDETGGQVRQELVEKVDDERLADLLDELPMDDAVEFLEDLPDEISGRLIGLMEPEEAAEVQELLAYEEETAGRLMTRDVVALRRQWTVSETFDYLRSLEDAETLHYLYVVDRDNRLIGVVPLRHCSSCRSQRPPLTRS